VLVLGCGVFVYSHPKDDDFAEFEDDEEFETDVFEDGDSEDGRQVCELLDMCKVRVSCHKQTLGMFAVK